MPTLNIAEFTAIPSSPDAAGMNCAAVPCVAAKNVTFAGTSTQSAVFDATTRLVRLVADSNCGVLFGSNPTATLTNSILLIANSPEYVQVAPGSVLKVAVIAR